MAITCKTATAGSATCKTASGASATCKTATAVSVTCINPFPAPEAALLTVSEAGTATLAGYSEFATPSLPPKKYRRCDVSGYWGNCAWGNPTNCTGNTANQDTMEYSGYALYDAVTALCTSLFVRKYRTTTAAIPCSQPLGSLSAYDTMPCDRPNNPTQTGNGDYFNHQVNEFNTQLTRYWDYLNGKNPPCNNTGTASVTWYGGVLWSLSIEDTENDAILRASVTAGSSPTAYRTSRGAGVFTFNFQEVSFDFPCSNLVVGYNYRITYEVLTEIYGGGSPSVITFTQDFLASGTSQTVTGGLLQATSGFQKTIQNVSIAPLS